MIIGKFDSVSTFILCTHVVAFCINSKIVHVKLKYLMRFQNRSPDSAIRCRTDYRLKKISFSFLNCEILLFVCCKRALGFSRFICQDLLSFYFLLQEGTQCFCFSDKTFFIVLYARNCSVFFSSVIKCFILVFSMVAYYLFLRSVVQLFSFSFSYLREYLMFLNQNYFYFFLSYI